METRLSISDSDSMHIRSSSGILAFLLAAGLLVCALHLAVNAGMRRIARGEFGAFNLAAEGRVNADVIVTGSSRAVLHYNPDVLQRATGLSVFNLGRIGSLTNIHTGILRFYLHQNRLPRLLIENADFTSLSTDDSVYDLPHYTPYLYDSGLYQALRQRYPAIWMARYLPLYGYVANDVEFRHYLGLKALLGIQPREYYQNGYLGKHQEWTQAFARLKANRKRLFAATNAEGMADFEQFLSEARSRGIPTVVVFSPVYCEHLAMVVGRTQMLASLAGIARKYDADFWDFSDLAPISGDTRFFYDSTHLNARGASAFSEVLGRRLAAWLTHRPRK
jgi:hypothetical protein